LEEYYGGVIGQCSLRSCMMPIKIACDECGQHYAFDVEPANGRMPSKVACPTCGMDGTVAANDFISQNLFPGQTITPPVIQPIREEELASAPLPARPGSASTSRRPDPRLGLVSREQAEHEARAKVMWGDSPAQIVSYLMVQGFTHPEATSLADDLFRERTGEVRKNGIGKIIKGSLLMCVPIVAVVFCLAIGFFIVKLVGAAILVGVYGAYLFIKGTLMALAPKSERGDVSEQ
jgi:hypothetical protein